MVNNHCNFNAICDIKILCAFLPLCASQTDTQAMPSQITACAPPNENCAPQKVTGSVPLECSSRPETPKILVITTEFEGKNRFFRRFCGQDLFFRFRIRVISLMLRNENLSFWSSLSAKSLCPPKIVHAPPSHV